ncbi:MAG TPA: alpha/beta hydrolase, partial [Acidimicrobiia bacterium]|nr:alpha/beta hydrolase [Acidimicrobiia bacterium]
IHGYTNSTHACLVHDSLDRLPQVTCPTLVLAGGQDVLYAVCASQQIADRVPDCTIKICEEASHFFLIQCFEESMQDIEDFLQRN